MEIVIKEEVGVEIGIVPFGIQGETEGSLSGDAVGWVNDLPGEESDIEPVPFKRGEEDIVENGLFDWESVRLYDLCDDDFSELLMESDQGGWDSVEGIEEPSLVEHTDVFLLDDGVLEIVVIPLLGYSSLFFQGWWPEGGLNIKVVVFAEELRIVVSIHLLYINLQKLMLSLIFPEILSEQAQSHRHLRGLLQACLGDPHSHLATFRPPLQLIHASQQDSYLLLLLSSLHSPFMSTLLLSNYALQVHNLQATIKLTIASDSTHDWIMLQVPHLHKCSRQCSFISIEKLFI